MAANAMSEESEMGRLQHKRPPGAAAFILVNVAGSKRSDECEQVVNDIIQRSKVTVNEKWVAFKRKKNPNDLVVSFDTSPPNYYDIVEKVQELFDSPAHKEQHMRVLPLDHKWMVFPWFDSDNERSVAQGIVRYLGLNSIILAKRWKKKDANTYCKAGQFMTPEVLKCDANLECRVGINNVMRTIRNIPFDNSCFKCQSCDHKAAQCTADPVCRKCAGNHVTANCTTPSSQHKCCRCNSTAHNSNSCPSIVVALRSRASAVASTQSYVAAAAAISPQHIEAVVEKAMEKATLRLLSHLDSSMQHLNNRIDRMDELVASRIAESTALIKSGQAKLASALERITALEARITSLEVSATSDTESPVRKKSKPAENNDNIQMDIHASLPSVSPSPSPASSSSSSSSSALSASASLNSAIKMPAPTNTHSERRGDRKGGSVSSTAKHTNTNEQ